MIKTFLMKGYLTSTGKSFSMQVEAQEGSEVSEHDDLKNPDLIVESINELSPDIRPQDTTWPVEPKPGLGWLNITDAPARGSVLVVARYPGNRNMTDVYTSWRDHEGNWARWPHSFPPTHFSYIGELPED